MKRSTAQKYDRASMRYDRMEGIIENHFFRRFRHLAVSLAVGKVLEVGVGTGKNLSHYRSGVELTAIDFSPGMLRRAGEKKEQLGMQGVELKEMDIERLSFADNTFDSVISTFVFCTVPDPVKGLAEVYRVLKPGGRAVFLEHMRSKNPLVNPFLYLMNIFSRIVLGTSMVRETQKNIEDSGLIILHVRHLLLDIVRLIITEKPGIRIN